MNNLGINVVEIDGRATPALQGAPTSVAGFVIRAERGHHLKDAVKQVTSFSQFLEHFGGFNSDKYGAYAIRGFFENGGSVAYVTQVLDSKAATVAYAKLSDTITVRAGYRGAEDYGAWGNSLAVKVVKNAPDSPTFDLVVRLRDNEVERWTGLKPGGTDIPVNDPQTGSRYIRLEWTAAVLPAATADFVLLDKGKDDTADANSLGGAFTRFDTYDIQLLCCPETSESSVVKQGLTTAANRGDCFFVSHVSDGTLESASSYGQNLQGKKVYGALYFPWIQVSDPVSKKTTWVPPTGHVLGIYARTEQERGIWKAPAGNAANLNGALDVSQHLTDIDHTLLVKNSSVNAVRYIPGQGIVIDSSRTLSTDPLWLYVNVRLLFNYVKTSLKRGLRWVVQEPNDSTLWNKVKFNTVTPFLLDLWRRGAFGPGAPDQVFTVKCDGDNNPPEKLQQGIFNLEVYFYPSRPAETIVITVGQQEGAGRAGER